ncbi:uncharacterized protein [Aegilops tauschii subsp. strangulata]|uniref:Uncharacterized protein n=3 Tax=Triticinae TaxID=1648030 RepID=A0A453LPR4_AEGTS|nr:uncharacterized protein LOC109766286 [Aegilops tauschii subsp. strangulata]XP_044398953.1 uncharacterized protein LOC123122697 [Triticum aestivum]
MAPLQARLHDQIKDSMVLINIKPPKKASVGKNKNDKGIFVMGTIIVLQPYFMYVVADPASFHGEGQLKLLIDCLEGTKLELTRPQIHLTEGIAGIRCPNPGGYNTQLMRAVPLCRSVIAKRQRVHLFSPEQMLLTSGTVMGVSGPTFQHNCSTLESSSLGAPVVNDNGHLVGICNDFRNDYLEAISTHAIASEIEMAQGREYIGIGQMLDHLQS